jgi:hypothetical protein
MRKQLLQAALAAAFLIVGTSAYAQIPSNSSISAIVAAVQAGNDSIMGTPGPGPVGPTEPESATGLPAELPVRTKSFSTALKNEAQSLDHVTISFLQTVAGEDFLRILPTSGRKPVLAAPFGVRVRSSQLPSIRSVAAPTAAQSYTVDSSLQTLVNWYNRQYGLDFVVRHTLLDGAHQGDTLTVARAVRRIGNTVVSVMIWNPTVSGSGRRARTIEQTSVEVQERMFRPREELIVEGPDAVVEFTWEVPYRDLIQKVSVKYQLDPYLLAALVQQESGFNAGAISVDSALGLTQMIPGTAELMGVHNPHDPGQSLDGGARYLKLMLAKFRGDVSLALAAYNAGPGNVIKYRGVPPFAETRDYVKRIMARYKEKAGGARAMIAEARIAS